MKNLTFFFVFISLFSCKLTNSTNFTLKQKQYGPIKIEPLKKGDKIAIVAPAYHCNNDNNLSKSIAWLEKKGFLVTTDYLNKKGEEEDLFSGSDEKRAEKFQKALDDDQIKAIWSLRGGYGSIRIIDKLDFRKFLKKPKWIIGYSDITIFHAYLQKHNIPSIHSIMARNLDDYTDSSLISLEKTLFGELPIYNIPSSNKNKEGKAQGILVGGNLMTLYSAGESLIDTKDKILFIEDVEEYLYSIDRILISLKRNGHLDHIKGLIVGSMTDLKDTNPKFGKSIYDIILKVVSEYSFPVVFDFPAGHDKNNQTLILGKEIILDAKKEKSTISYVMGK